MAIIRLDMITENEYSHVVVTSEEEACKVIDDYMHRNGISDCTMASKEDLYGVNGAIAEHFKDDWNLDNYVEWHDITKAVRDYIVHFLADTDCVSDKDVLRIVGILGENNIDITEIW